MITKLLGTSIATMIISFLLIVIFEDLWMDWFRYVLTGLLIFSFFSSVILVYLWIWS